MQVVDFHVHTKYSKDSNIEPKELIKKARKLGYTALGITDHNEVRGALYTKKINRYKELLILVGQEVKTEKGELIVFGTSENLSNKNFFELLDYARDNNLFLVIPHRFDWIRASALSRHLSYEEIRKCAEKVDAIECMNARALFDRFNNKAKDFAMAIGKPCVAGSDSHLLEEFGAVKTYVDAEHSEEDIYEAVRKGLCRVEGKRNLFVVHFKSFLIRLTK